MTERTIRRARKNRLTMQQSFAVERKLRELVAPGEPCNPAVLAPVLQQAMGFEVTACNAWYICRQAGIPVLNRLDKRVGRSRSVRKERIERIRQLTREGRSTEEIAKELDISHRMVSRTQNEYAIELVPVLRNKLQMLAPVVEEHQRQIDLLNDFIIGLDPQFKLSAT